MVKIFTMVKGEDDIVEDWVLYHGYLFGFENLYIIDNLSRDNTYPILLKLKKDYNINICRLGDYKKKGEYMTMLFRQFCRNEYGIPLDIDEFLVYYDRSKNEISCSRDIILNTLKHLPRSEVYKMEYIQSKLTNKNGYTRATIEGNWGSYTPYNSFAKSFFHSSIFRGVIDHGNHYNTTNYVLTPFCLVHFHNRNIDQMRKKVFNNVSGLGYDPFNLKNLKIIGNNTSNPGFHHVKKQVEMLTNQYNLPYEEHVDDDISLKPLNDFFINK
jgi:hypothetical protein